MSDQIPPDARCPHGHTVEPGQAFCPSCGQPLLPKTKQQRKLNGRVGFLISVLLIVLALAFSQWRSTRTDGSSSDSSTSSAEEPQATTTDDIVHAACTNGD